MAKTENSVIKIGENDRTGDGNLRPEAKEKARRMVAEYVRETGRVNISELSKELALSRPTVRNLADEVLADWRGEIEDQAVVIHKWCERVAKEIDARPDDFDKDEIARVRLKLQMLDKMRAMRKVLRRGGE
ncbi:MAG: hypothetical protein ABSC29_01565 [Minisyncoccia bacterium]|jgi:Ser-tRNA(Ala) deacylase AlaX